MLQYKMLVDCRELEIPFKVQNRHELFNDPWGGLSEIDLQRITSCGTYSHVEVKRMHVKCVGERADPVVIPRQMT